MAKKALLDVLEKTIGKYVLNLDPSSLNVAVWSGKIQLNALELNVASVNAELDRQAAVAPNLALPFRVVSGQFDSFSVDVPWANLMSKPVVLRAGGLQVSVEPVDRTTIDKIAHASGKSGSAAAVSAEKRVREARIQSIAVADDYRLQKAALRKLAEQDLEENKETDKNKNSSSQSSFGARLVRRILENIQIEISNVHISLQGAESSAGVVLKSLQLVTTDANGNRTFVDRTTTTNNLGNSFLHKLLQIRGLGIYLDEKIGGATLATDAHLASISEGSSNNNINSNDYEEDEDDSHTYVLAPLSFQSTLVQADSNLCIDYPKYALQSELASLCIALTKTQVELARKIGYQIQPAMDAARPLFPEYRPASRPTSSSTAARQWWYYAYRSVGRLNGRRSWREFLYAFQLRKKYIPLYKRHAHAATCPWMKPLSIPEMAELKSMEEEERCISIEGIMTWRGIADAQMAKERAKHEAKKNSQQQAAPPKSSVFSSIFGGGAAKRTTTATTTSSEDDNDDDDDDPPVHLTVEELRALEDLALEQFAEADELSKDSKLCSLQFVLGSFHVNLTTHGLRQLAALHMGTVSTSFDANADGSFAFDLDLRSLEIQDCFTPQSLFPTILQNQKGTINDVDSDRDDRAFQFQMAKSKTGDQLLKVKLNTFEMIASPMLVTELSRFIAAERIVAPPTTLHEANPLLRQSLSGSVDLFYDATEGGASLSQLGLGLGLVTSASSGAGSAAALAAAPGTTTHGALTSTTTNSSSAAATGLVEAWKAKTEKKTSWILDFDISAPIVVVPSSCVDARANVLVFDLGNLALRYGKIDNDASAQHVKVKEWFAANPRIDDGKNKGSGGTGEPSYDYGCVRISSLTFSIGRASYWRRLVKKHQQNGHGSGQVTTTTTTTPPPLDSDDQVIAPISLNMDLGVESRRMDDIPRACAFCVLPSISLGMSPAQLGRIISVGKAWMQVMKEVSPKPHQDDDDDDVDNADGGASVLSLSTAGSTLWETSQRRSSSLILPTSTGSSSSSFALFHVDARLQGFSLKIATDSGNGVEAHLVSVAARASTFSDGSFTSQVSMGWFWILDMLDNSFPRCQRLIAHSSLPLEASAFAQDGNDYAILQELERRGVFQDDFSGSSDLADITYRHSGSKMFGKKDPFGSIGELLGDDYAVNSVVDAKFSSLYINWNPSAVKTITSALDHFSATIKNAEMRPTSGGGIILSSPEPDKRRMVLGGSLRTKDGAKPDGEPIQSGIVVRAEMKSLQVCLRSARDDIPLFTLTMSSTRCSYASVDEQEMKLFLALGDLSIDSPELGRTHSLYRTILGLSPGTTESLLSVEYCDGARAMEPITLDNVDKSTLGACSTITLSPMRLVYIHAQVMALVEYATEGILGALTRQAASSAVAAAADIATSGSSRKFFNVQATGFQILVPQAAHRANYLSMETGALSVGYTGFPDPGGGHASISVSNVLLKDSEQVEMQSSPTQMTIDVKLPPLDVGSKEDQALRVSVGIQSGLFRISQSQYRQIRLLKDENFSEVDLFLRDELLVPGFGEGEALEQLPEDADIPGELTHAGVAVVETERRMYIDIAIGVLSMDLFGMDFYDPIIRLKAVDSSVCLKMIADEEKFVATVTLQNLVCDDERTKSFGRQYRSLIYRDHGSTDMDDIFFLSYESRADQSSSIDLKIGSPRIVFVPDAISDTLAFVSMPESVSAQVPETKVREPVERRTVHVDSHTSSEIETLYVVETLPIDPEMLCTMSFSMKTGDCSIILVDLGSNSLVAGSSGSGSVAETLVVKGIFDASVVMKSDTVSGDRVEMESKVNGDDVEVYTAFGKELSPVQIIDPLKITLHYSTKTHNDSSTSVDIRVATISELYAVVSMRDFALVNAILSGMSECFDDDDIETSSDEDNRRSLSRQEANRILQLDKELEADEIESSTHSVTSPDVSSHGQLTVEANEASSTQSVKITLPFAQLTIVNDLQGLDDALLRVMVHNLVANGQIRTGGSTLFDANLYSNINSDYFDASNKIWKELLVDPWEISIKARRGTNRAMQSSSRRLSTTLDVESFPCHLSFSEEFLMSLASANRMWSVYSVATSSAAVAVDEKKINASRLKRSMAASAARTLVTSLPYALENHSGVEVEFLVNGSIDRRTCESGSMEYFRFPPPKGRGSGGSRLYGQDLTYKKSVKLFVGDSNVDLGSLDDELEHGRRVHNLPTGCTLTTVVAKEGKTVVLHISSGIDFHNKTSLPFSLVLTRNSLTDGAKNYSLGLCQPETPACDQHRGFTSVRASTVVKDGRMSRKSLDFGVPVRLLESFRTEWASQGKAMIRVQISPRIADLRTGWELKGALELELEKHMFSGDQKTIMCRFDVTCKPSQRSDVTENISGLPPVDAFVVQVKVIATLIDDLHPAVDISLEPRALIENRLPLGITVKSPMPHLFSAVRHEDDKASVHELQPFTGAMEVFTPGPSVAISFKCTDVPVAGTATDWIEEKWIDLPLISQFRLPEPIFCRLPFKKSADPLALAGSHGTDVIIADGANGLSALSLESTPGATAGENAGVEVAPPPMYQDEWRTFLVTACHYAVDHTGEILFEQLEASSGPSAIHRSHSDHQMNKASFHRQVSAPIGAYRSPRHRGRISVLPGADVQIRFLYLTMEGAEGLRRSAPFRIEDISICDGGVNSTMLNWETGLFSGFFAYRRLVNSYQSEIHIIPEYVVYNGNKDYAIRVRQPGGAIVTIQPGEIGPLQTNAQQPAAMAVEFVDFDWRTAPLRVDSLGLRVAVVKSYDGSPIGSLALQTVMGAQDSRLVVKVGEIKLGSAAAREVPAVELGMFRHDMIRCRVQWSELKITLSEALPFVERDMTFFDTALERIAAASPGSNEGVTISPTQMMKDNSRPSWVESRQRYKEENKDRTKSERLDAVCSILLYRFTVDWQRVFKEDTSSSRTTARKSAERAQLSVIVHNVQLRDETPGSPYPVVFDSTSDVSFFDLCIRFHGSMTNSELIKVDLFDLNLAHQKGKTEKIVLKTSEDFVWKLLDLVEAIIKAAGEFTGVEIELEYDDEHGGYTVHMKEKSSYIDEGTKYTPPSSDTLYDIRRVRVSPFTVEVSFKRNPAASRYTSLTTEDRGAALMNYFTHRLKFKIEKAELRFARYEAANVKGPSDRLVELLSTVYMSRTKLKLVTIMTAASFQDWKFLASRDGGDDEFVEGDILRVTGNLAGNMADFVMKKAGRGLGSGIEKATRSLGDGIENATGAIGAQQLGAGVNSLVSGVGGGFGETISGVGAGAGHVFKGAGQGLGQAVGGMTGGALLVSKGIGKGIKHGDGMAVASGVAEGVASVGMGVGQGVGSVVTGAATGALSVGSGIVSGFQSVGSGIKGAFVGKKPPAKKNQRSPSQRGNS